MRILGELRPLNEGVTWAVSVAAAEVALPTEWVKTARYWLPFREAELVKESVAEVAPAMSVKLLPLSVLTCHWTVGVGLPLAAAVKVTVCPAGTAWLTGWVVT